jgi:enoyl-CoA hydratase/carnithine racemase
MRTTIDVRELPDRVELVLGPAGGVPVLRPPDVAGLRAGVALAADRPVVVRSVGRAFCAGMDMGSLEIESDADLLARFVEVELLLSELRCAAGTMAVVDGAAVGAGADIAAACRVRVGTGRASFRFPGYGFGVLLGTGRLVRLVGASAARSILEGSRTVRAEEARDRGLLTDLVAPPGQDELDRLVAGLTTELVAATEAAAGAFDLVERELEREAVAPDLGRLVRSVAAGSITERFLVHRESARAR